MYFIKYNPQFRNYVVGVNTRIPLADGSYTTAINFDNAATTPPFWSVLREILNYSPWYSSIHRGTGYKSQLSSQLYETCRSTILNFVNGDPSKDVVIFVKNTTEAINKLSHRLCTENKKSVVLSSCMEHHSNDLPWRGKYIIDYIQIDEHGKLSLESLESLLNKYKGNVQLVTITGASNVTGYVNPIYEIAEIVHKHGAQLLVDGAQYIPHIPFSMFPHSNPQHIDYIVFSAHKMYAPFGSGVLIGHKKVFELGAPEQMGGGTVKMVTHNFIDWEDPPHKEEAGTPNIMGAVALATAIQTLNQIGMNNIKMYEESLTYYALHELKKISGVLLYGDNHNRSGKVGIIPFNLEGIPHYVTARALSFEAGISVRNGCFCAQPYMQKLLSVSKEEIQKYAANPDLEGPGMVRISFGLYNTYEEIDILIEAIRKIIKNKNSIIEKYETSPTIF